MRAFVLPAAAFCGVIIAYGILGERLLQEWAAAGGAISPAVGAVLLALFGPLYLMFDFYYRRR